MGRPKGRPNKRSIMLENELHRLGINLPEAIADLLLAPKRTDSLSDKDKLNAYLELLQYVYPKRKALEIEASGIEMPKVFVLKWADEDTEDNPSSS